MHIQVSKISPLGEIHPVSDNTHSSDVKQFAETKSSKKNANGITDGDDKTGKARQGFIIPFLPDKSYFSDLSTQKQLPIPTFGTGTRQNCTPSPTNGNYFRTWLLVHRPAKRWREQKLSADQRRKNTKAFVSRLLSILDDKGVQS